MGETKTSHKPATSADVAKLADLSRSTVSAILNGNTQRFPESTVRRVLDAAKELSYAPSPAAKALVSGNSGTVVLLLPNTTFGSQVQDLADRLVEDLGTAISNVVVRFMGGDLKKLFKSLRALSPSAVVNFGALSLEDCMKFEAEGFSVVPKIDSETQSIGEGDRGVAALQLSTMSDRSTRRIIYAALKEKRTDVFGPKRFEALQKRCGDEGLRAPHWVEVDPGLGPWRDGTAQLLAEYGHERFAIVCYNDDVALAVLAGARELGLSVPEQISVVGMDGTIAGSLWSPRLTSIKMDLPLYADYLAALLEAKFSASERSPLRDASDFFSVLKGESTI